MSISTGHTSAVSRHDPSDIRFACDAMCGGLARWLRAIGYDATWSPDIEDGELVRQAHQQGRILLSGDSGVFERRLIARGHVRALEIPRGLRRMEQLQFVARQLQLPIRPPRCMSCGGTLLSVSRDEVASEVPRRSLLWAKKFYRCSRCEKVFWEGSHWRRIHKVRQEMAAQPEP